MSAHGDLAGLVYFLQARLDEDEMAAKAATPGPWWYNPGKQWLGPEAFEKYDLRQGEEFVGYGGPSPFVGAVAATGPADNPQSMADAAHIARHDPARVLRAVEARRRTVDEYANNAPLSFEEWPLFPLVNMVREYADHPDFKAGWAPDLF